VNRIKNLVGLTPQMEECDEDDLYDELYGSANDDEELELIRRILLKAVEKTI